ncbi:MAG: bifunctional sulfate adenylyltransferase/adenylylsulfate kinase [Patescibacteria group bacterium]|nr:bifunctional sulfate adenylyltransferase/adenylylsulfate kinase [Patescibacteria group bacterium]
MSKPAKRSNSRSFRGHGGPLRELITHGEDHRAWKEKIVTLPRLNLNNRQLYDLELLLNGGFSPLRGFLDAENYASVVQHGRLSDGTIWPIPIVLDVAEGRAFSAGQEIALCDAFGKPLAVLSVTSVYRPDILREATEVYGTIDPAHPGVKYLLQETGRVYLGGEIYGLALSDQYDFSDLRHTPRQLREWFATNGWERIVGFQTRNPLHRAHVAMIQRAMAQHGARALLHPVVGLTKENDVDYVTRVRCYQKIHRHHLGAEASKLSLLPLAMRMAGPREAVLHAIIRKNYGCTHFIVGRDHAGPGADATGRPFYNPYDAQTAAAKAADEIGIEIIPMSEFVYVAERHQYLPVNEVPTGHTVKKISGTQLRQMLADDAEIPEWFSFPEVIEVLRRSTQRQRNSGLTVFFTGLPSAGKSTLATRLYAKLLELQDKAVTLLDGDVIRQHLSKGLGFSKEDRDINIARIGFVASEITKHGGIAICAAVSPYEEARRKNRQLIGRYGRYVEVYVSTPLSVCRQRDPKGLYSRAAQGLSQNVTGVTDPYEPPKSPEITIDTTDIDPEAAVERILQYLGIPRPEHSASDQLRAETRGAARNTTSP